MRLRRDRRSERITEALERNAAWTALSREAKLEVLDARLGKGVGAERQRQKLQESDNG